MEQIDFAARSCNMKRRKWALKEDVVTTLDERFTGKLEGDSFPQIFPWGESPLAFENVVRLVKRVTLEADANAFGTLRIFRVLGRTDGVLFGTDTYSLDSCVGTTAVHARLLLPGQTGLVKVEIVPSGEPFEGSTRHGVTSDAYDADPRGAFRFLRD